MIIKGESSMIRTTIICGMALAICGCAKHNNIMYNPNDFVNPNKVVTKTVMQSLPAQKVNATFGVGNDPAVVRAYKLYSKSGVAHTINSAGFKTVGYDSESHPIISCEPLHLCVVQLERGEKINNIDLGDSSNWLVGTSLIGSASDGSYAVTVKPKRFDISTDMIVYTNKRTYNIGLVSEKGSITRVLRFYYPQETLDNAVAKYKQDDTMQQQVVSDTTKMNVNNIHFNYQLSGDNPIWKPTRVFDDGHKTFIAMPSISSEMDLPVLYLLRQGHMQLVNYRYKAPYYIVDGIFREGFLISGKGSSQVKVAIRNRNFG